MVLDFLINYNETNQTPIINVKGELDIYTSQKLRTILTDLIDNNKKNIILNLKDLLYMDSTGLGTIVQAANNLATKDGKLHIVAVKPTIKKIFEVSGITNKNFIVFDEELKTTKE